MAELLESGTSVLYLTHGVVVANKKTFPIYGGIVDADNYFYAHPKYDLWSDLEQIQKWRYLVAATRIVDRLNFVGQKANDIQSLQFPRDIATEVPIPIVQAAYEIALAFAEGLDPDVEARNLSVTSQGYAGSKTDYERAFVADHLRAGVPSHGAWLLLCPYLRDPHAVDIVRVS